MDYWHKCWTCPFFAWDDMLRVHCEGGSRIAFPDKQAAREFMNTYCAGKGNGWKQCGIASALLRYYERQGDKNHEKKSG